ncbi:hypothetical protein ES705_05965 [subsurface metagenome]
MLDSFANLTDQEAKKKVDSWFFDLEHLEKLRILLRVYEKLNVTKIEEQGISTLWRKIDLVLRKYIFQDQWKYQK